MSRNTRDSLALEDILGNAALQSRFRIKAEAIDGLLVIRSGALRDGKGKSLEYSLPLDEIASICLVSAPGRPQALQVQSVKAGTICSGYREVTIMADGKASTREGIASRSWHSYSI